MRCRSGRAPAQQKAPSWMAGAATALRFAAYGRPQSVNSVDPYLYPLSGPCPQHRGGLPRGRYGENMPTCQQQLLRETAGRAQLCEKDRWHAQPRKSVANIATLSIRFHVQPRACLQLVNKVVSTGGAPTINDKPHAVQAKLDALSSKRALRPPTASH